MENKQTNKLFLYAEFTLLFLILPFILYFFRLKLKRLLIPTLVVMGIICLVILLRDKNFKRKQLWNPISFKVFLKTVFLRFIVFAGIISVLVFFFYNRLFLSFPKHRFYLWLMVMVLYPLISVYVQEIIYRAFIFHRYKPIFNSETNLIIASAVSFGLVHVVFGNLIAPLMTTLGGFMFAYNYSKNRSTLCVCIEHGLWGDFIFTIGLGIHFYSGAISA